MNSAKAVSYLWSCYNSEVGLCFEAPIVAPNNFWVWIDNVLASRTLYDYDRTLCHQLLIGIEKYGSNFFNEDAHKRIEVLWGSTNINFPFQYPIKYQVSNNVLNEECR